MASYLHSNCRDLSAWKDAGLPLSTTSNEAAKLYNAVLTQASVACAPSFGGIEASVAKVLAVDEKFGPFFHMLKFDDMNFSV
eukprot:m.238366 g.238366  ORF g.238366 m.238366 type:complete len:82 (+) comp40163_c0_seq7:292-537(+)